MCCGGHPDAGLVALDEVACETDCGGGGRSLEGNGIVGAICS